MKKTITLIMVFGIVFLTRINAQNFEWVKTMDGSDRVTSLVTDANENVYATGYFSGTVDFDPGVGTWNLTSLGQGDIFISKMNAAGDFQWVKHIGGTEWEQGNSIALDDKGNIYITGGFQGIVDFNPDTAISESFILTATGASFDIFVLKLNSDGTFTWAKQIGGANTDFGHAIVADYESSIYITGRFIETVDFDPDTYGSYILNSSGYDEAFICKLDSSGNFNWAMKLGQDNYDSGESIKVDSQGNVHTTGVFGGTVDFDPGPGTYNLTSSGGSPDVYILKLTKGGNFLWAKHFESPLWDYTPDIELDNLGNTYCAGGFQGKIDVNPGLGMGDTCFFSSGGSYICKLDSLGNFVWAKHLQGECKIHAIELDDYANVYTTGDFNLTVDFDPGESSTFILSGYDSDVFISKLDSSGQFSWVSQLAGYQTYEVGLALSLYNENVYCAGVFTGTVDFNPDTVATYSRTSDGNDDAFIHKMNQCQLDTSVTQDETSLVANASGVTYQWLNCNNAYAPIAGETNQTFSPSQSGNYAVKIMQNGCVDTSSCYQFSIISILENDLTSDILVYPNPTKGLVKIDLGEVLKEFTVRINDESGKLIRQSTYKETQLFEINLADQPGVYLLIIDSGNKITTLRLIKD
jgi:hypothetical protein